MYAGRYWLSKSRSKEARSQAILKKPVSHRMLFSYRDCVNYANTHELRTSEWYDHLFMLENEDVNFNGSRNWTVLGVMIFSGVWKVGTGTFELVLGNLGEYESVIEWTDNSEDKTVGILAGQYDEDASDLEVISLQGDPVRCVTVKGRSSGAFGVWIKKGESGWKPSEAGCVVKCLVFVE